jgi:hypothetical protein
MLNWTRAAFLAAPLALAGAFAPTGAQASPIIETIEGNDCAGVLGRPFENCAYNGSPIIAKFNLENGNFVGQINSTIFPSVTGGEFSISYDSVTNSGSWTYTPGAGDPLITVFVVKWGPQFTVFANDGDPNSGSFVIPGQQGLSHISFYDTQVPVPAPAALALFGVALAGLGLAMRRRAA